MTPLAQDMWLPASKYCCDAERLTGPNALGWYREAGQIRIVCVSRGLWRSTETLCETTQPDLWMPWPPAPEVGGYGHGVAPKVGWPTPGYDRYAAEDAKPMPDQTNDSKGGYQ